MPDDPRLDLARARPILEVWDRLGAPSRLKLSSFEHVGPCPVCGGRDRFSLSPRKNVFNCRNKDCGGGDAIRLVELVMGCDFLAALDFLEGRRDLGLSPEEAARRKALAEAAKAKREAEAEAYRRRAISDALEMLARSAPAAGSPVEAYLRLRRCHVPAALGALRFAADHPYRKDGKVHHRGPAMLAPVTDSRGRVTAAHQTWIDLARPKGKAEIRHCETGEALKAKLVRGSKGDGAIRLVTDPSLARPGAELVIGEGIETVLSASARGVPEGASFWASVDLGHLAGKAAYVDGKRRPDLPDLTDKDAFRAPRSLARLWLIRDGDSDPKATRAALLRCFARQAARIPGLEGRIVDPGDGRDLNDLALIGPADDALRGAADRDDPREPPLRARGGLDGGEARP